jgi:MFS family permease
MQPNKQEVASMDDSTAVGDDLWVDRSDSRGQRALLAVAAKVAWRLMPVIMICYMFAFFDRIIISFAKFQLQADLSLNDTAYGIGAGLFSLGYVLFEVPSNLFLYRVGARRWIARIIITWGLFTALTVFIRTDWQFYGLRFMVGAAEAGLAPGILYYMTLWFPSAYRGRVTSFMFLASACSGIIGGPVSGLILGGLDGVLGLRGWHWLFLAGGIPCVFLGVLVLRRLDDRIRDARWLGEREKAVLEQAIAQEHKAIEGGHSLFGAVKTPGFLMLGLIYFLIQVASYGLNFWVPQLIRTAGITDPKLIGAAAAIPYVCGAVTMLVLGRAADATGERRKFVVGCLLTATTGLILSGIFDLNSWALMGSIALMGAGIIASIPAFWALPPKLVTGAGAAGGMALINTLGQLGGLVSPIMVGSIRDLSGSTTPALYTIAALCVLAAALIMFALPERLRRKEVDVVMAA